MKFKNYHKITVVAKYYTYIHKVILFNYRFKILRLKSTHEIYS